MSILRKGLEGCVEMTNELEINDAYSFSLF